MGDPKVLRADLANDALLLTSEEAAQVLRIGRTTIYALIKEGQLRPIHIGRSCRLSRAELQRYVNRLDAPPPDVPPIRGQAGEPPRTHTDSSTSARCHPTPHDVVTRPPV